MPDVRFGSLADIQERQSHVRFTPESRHAERQHRCPLSANNGHSAIGVPNRKGGWPTSTRQLLHELVEDRRVTHGVGVVVHQQDLVAGVFSPRHYSPTSEPNGIGNPQWARARFSPPTSRRPVTGMTPCPPGTLPETGYRRLPMSL